MSILYAQPILITPVNKPNSAIQDQDKLITINSCILNLIFSFMDVKSFGSLEVTCKDLHARIYKQPSIIARRIGNRAPEKQFIIDYPVETKIFFRLTSRDISNINLIYPELQEMCHSKTRAGKIFKEIKKENIDKKVRLNILIDLVNNFYLDKKLLGDIFSYVEGFDIRDEIFFFKKTTIHYKNNIIHYNIFCENISSKKSLEIFLNQVCENLNMSIEIINNILDEYSKNKLCEFFILVKVIRNCNGSKDILNRVLHILSDGHLNTLHEFAVLKECLLIFNDNRIVLNNILSVGFKLKIKFLIFFILIIKNPNSDKSICKKISKYIHSSDTGLSKDKIDIISNLIEMRGETGLFN